MSAAVALLERLKASGLTVEVDGEHIEINGPDAALDTLPVEELRAHKAEIIQVLTCARATSPKPPAITADEVVARIETWCRVCDNPPAGASEMWKNLADATLDFALGCWAYVAGMTGWSDGALYALDEGLIPEKLHRKLHIMKIETDAATVMNGKGDVEHFRRPRTLAPPWWQDPRVAAHQSTSARVARKGT
jgi:TubC N-terminal docking domain